jgi:hypothetical protein
MTALCQSLRRDWILFSDYLLTGAREVFVYFESFSSVQGVITECLNRVNEIRNSTLFIKTVGKSLAEKKNMS